MKFEMPSPKYDFSSALLEIQERIQEYYPDFGTAQKKLLEEAFEFGLKSHHEQWRESGHPYFSHEVEATKILLSIKPDMETILACLLHDVIEDTPITAEEVEQKFGKKIRFLCEGVAKVSRVQLKEHERPSRAESIQKLFIAVAQDIRVIFVKLADRIHNLKTLEHVPAEKRERIAQESLQIYAPVADKLGLFEFKTQIEDLCFQHLHPTFFRQLHREIEDVKKQKRGFLERSRKEILTAFKKEQLQILEISGRQKSISSVYSKMKRKSFSSVTELYDLFGFRIIVRTKEDCYRALGILHTYWKPMPNRFKDYISVPKPNGYQSLHTTLLGLSGSKFPTEIQIRTLQMHQDAEFGPASHWAYKKTRHSHFDKDYLRRMSWFPQNIPQEIQTSPEKFFEEISQNILADRIFVFTPKGDIETLPEGSTPVDFAYTIHSDVGNTCVGAKVNGMIKPLDFKLKNGDIVEILTREGRTPNSAWLDFVQSSHARTHIRSFLNKQDETRTPSKSSQKELLSEKKPAPVKTPRKFVEKERHIGELNIVIGGEREMPFRLASCCKPKLGQNIVAFKSRSPHFTIHRANCRQVDRLDPERILEAYFLVEQFFEIKAYDRIGLTRDYATIIANHGLNIGELSSYYSYDQEGHRIVTWKFTLESVSTEEIRNLLRDLEKINKVIYAKQLTGPKS